TRLRLLVLWILKEAVLMIHYRLAKAELISLMEMIGLLNLKGDEMKKILALILMSVMMTSFAEARSAYQIQRMPSSGNIPSYGSIDLSQSAAVGSSVLPQANGGTAIASYSNGDILY